LTPLSRESHGSLSRQAWNSPSLIHSTYTISSLDRFRAVLECMLESRCSLPGCSMPNCEYPEARAEFAHWSGVTPSEYMEKIRVLQS
jgi:hypothetical protein